MNFDLYSSLRRAGLVAAAVCAACVGTTALAEPKAMDNSEMSDVVGGDGVSIIADINVHISRVSRDFNGGDIHEQQHEKSSRSVILATWDDVPHLDERAKEMLFASYMPFQRDARTKGIPALGSGAIYSVPESYENESGWIR